MTEALSPAGLERIAEAIAGHAGDDRVPGIVALVAAGEGAREVHTWSAGSLSLGGPPVERDSLFRIASTTKTLTAAAVLVLAEEGRLGLDDPAELLLPELAGQQVLRRIDGPLDDTVPPARPPTVRELLSFTFGFGIAVESFAATERWPVVAAAEELELAAFGPPAPAVQPDTDTWLSRFATLPLMVQPGQRWLYNTGAPLAGVLAGRAAGMPFGEVLRSRVLEPLGMVDTAFFARDPSRLGSTYRAAPEGLVLWDPPQGQWSGPPRFEDGGAGLVSTADDLLAFARCLIGGGAPLLSAASVAELTREQVTPEQLAGAGPILGRRSWGLCTSLVTSGERSGAFGWDGGLGTSWLVDPVRRLVVIVLTTRMFDTAALPAVHAEVQRAAYAALA